MNKKLYIRVQLFLALSFVAAVASIIIVLIKGNTLSLAISGWALVAILAIAGFLLSALLYLSGAMKQLQEEERSKTSNKNLTEGNRNDNKNFNGR